MATLSAAVMRHIFGFLTAVDVVPLLRVSKAFQDAASAPHVFRIIDLSYPRLRRLESKYIEQLIARAGSSLSVLKLDYAAEVTDSTLQALLRKDAPHLSLLSLRRCPDVSHGFLVRVLANTRVRQLDLGQTLDRSDPLSKKLLATPGGVLNQMRKGRCDQCKKTALVRSCAICHGASCGDFSCDGLTIDYCVTCKLSYCDRCRLVQMCGDASFHPATCALPDTRCIKCTTFLPVCVPLGSLAVPDVHCVLSLGQCTSCQLSSGQEKTCSLCTVFCGECNVPKCINCKCRVVEACHCQGFDGCGVRCAGMKENGHHCKVCSTHFCRDCWPRVKRVHLGAGHKERVRQEQALKADAAAAMSKSKPASAKGTVSESKRTVSESKKRA